MTSLSILSKMDNMRVVSATDAKQRFASVLDAAQREPVLIRRQNRDVAVIMSAEEYERIRVERVAALQCDQRGVLMRRARGTVLAEVTHHAPAAISFEQAAYAR